MRREKFFWTVKDEEGEIRPMTVLEVAEVDKLTGKDYGLGAVQDWVNKHKKNQVYTVVKVELVEVFE